jgi:site-specific DNA recombinase
MEAQGAKAAIAATLDAADEARGHNPTGSLLILAKSNAAVAAISRVARERRKAAELITGDEVTFTAATPSGHATQIALAAGDKIRFLVRNDEAKTATDDRRPVLQEMIDRACGPDHPYDAIVFYAFNRFFRNVAEMELTIRKLRKHGVDVVSVTQPTGDDPSQILVRQILVRQIIGAFDEHTSREISKNTKRAMLESARQGFWNGATPPLGYKIVEAERRGRRSKRSSTPIR